MTEKTIRWVCPATATKPEMATENRGLAQRLMFYLYGKDDQPELHIDEPVGVSILSQYQVSYQFTRKEYRMVDGPDDAKAFLAEWEATHKKPWEATHKKPTEVVNDMLQAMLVGSGASGTPSRMMFRRAFFDQLKEECEEYASGDSPRLSDRDGEGFLFNTPFGPIWFDLDPRDQEAI